MLIPSKTACSGKNKDYWQLVESCRTELGPRQRVVAYLGDMDEPERLGLKETASGNDDHIHQISLFEDSKLRWTQVDTSNVKVERTKSFGGAWLCMQVCIALVVSKF